MIAFIGRFLVLLFLFISFAMNVLFFTLGEPKEETWRFLWENMDYDIPLVALIIFVALTFSFIIALWMTISVKLKENQTTRSGTS